MTLSKKVESLRPNKQGLLSEPLLVLYVKVCVWLPANWHGLKKQDSTIVSKWIQSLELEEPSAVPVAAEKHESGVLVRD